MTNFTGSMAPGSSYIGATHISRAMSKYSVFPLLCLIELLSLSAWETPAALRNTPRLSYPSPKMPPSPAGSLVPYFRPELKPCKHEQSRPNLAFPVSKR